MGLNKRNANVTYVNISKGKFYESTDKERTNPYDEIEGVITSMGFRNDEFNGQPIRKLMLTISDGNEDLVVSMKTDSSYFSSLVGFLKSVDVSRVLTLIPLYKEDGDKLQLSILVKQDGKFAKAYYTKDHKNGLPDFKKVVVSGKTLWDKTDYLAFLEGVIETELKPNLSKDGVPSAPQGLRSAAPVTQEAAPVMSHNGEEVADDLPF